MICKLVQIDRINKTCVSLVLEGRGIASTAKPGQFIHIKCGEERILRRPISICDVDAEYIRIVVDVKGEGTKWLSRLLPGDRIDVLGPLGQGFTINNTDRIILVGGGVGVPPLLFSAKKTECTADAVLGFRSRDCAMLIKEFQDACSNVFICTDDGSFGKKCTVDKELERVLEKGVYTRIAACGPIPMLKAVAKIAERFGIKCEVSLEERMGCGVGACLVCACKVFSGGKEKYLHVCRNGPVFKAEEVVW